MRRLASSQLSWCFAQSPLGAWVVNGTPSRIAAGSGVGDGDGMGVASRVGEGEGETSEMGGSLERSGTVDSPPRACFTASAPAAETITTTTSSRTLTVPPICTRGEPTRLKVDGGSEL